MADNFDQAIDDLAWDWNRERRQTWAIDTGTPETETQQHPLVIEADKQAPTSLRATLGRARLKAERASPWPPAGGHTDPHTRQQLRKLDLHIDALDQKLEPRRRPLPQEYAERSAAPTPEHRFGTSCSRRQRSCTRHARLAQFNPRSFDPKTWFGQL